MSFDRGPGQAPVYSGNFTTQGGALYAGDGQNAGRDIINIFAEVVYLSRKKKESTVSLKPDQKSAWRDFRKALQSLGVNPIALTEQQVGLLLKSIAEITGEKDAPKPEASQNTSAQPNESQETEEAENIPSSHESSEDSFTDDTSSSSEYSDAQEDNLDIALHSPAKREQNLDNNISTLDSGPVRDLQISKSNTRTVTREQISILQDALQGLRRQYPPPNRPEQANDKALQGSLRVSYEQNASEIVGMPIQSSHTFNDSLLDKEKSSFFAALQPIPPASSVNKDDWTSLKKELKEVGISVVLVSDKSRGQPSSFGQSAQQSFREWCHAKKVPVSQIEDRCMPRIRAFIKAVRDDDEIEARVLIWRGANVNALMTDQKSALHVAVEKKSLSMIRLLMQNGANANQLDSYGVSPLHQAATASDHFEIIDALLSQGGNINVHGYDNWQPIHVAAVWGHTSTLKAIIARGANVNAITRSHSTALMLAASEGRANCVQILIDEGAEVDKIDNGGKSALFYALEHRSINTFELLLDHGAVLDKPDYMRRTILHCVAAAGNESMANMLLDRNAPIEVYDRSLATPLHVAASFGHYNIVSLLIRRGSNVEVFDIHGRTPLHVAALGDYSRTVRLLLQNGATPYTYDKSNSSPMKCVIRDNSEATAQVLYEHNVTFEDLSEWPALYVAVRMRHHRMVDFLIARGASIEAFGRSDEKNALLYATYDGSLTIVRTLLSLGGANVEARTRDGGSTALHIAAFYGRKETLKLLLKSNANANAVDNFGYNALHKAAQLGSVSICRLLLQGGTNPGHEAHDGNLPLTIAIAYGNHRVVDLLLKENVDVTLDEIQDALERMRLCGDVPRPDMRKVKQVLLSKFSDLDLGSDTDLRITVLRDTLGIPKVDSGRLSNLHQPSQIPSLDIVPYNRTPQDSGVNIEPTMAAPSQSSNGRDRPGRTVEKKSVEFVHIIEEPFEPINASNTTYKDRPSGGRRRRSRGDGLQPPEPEPEETPPRSSKHRSKKKRRHRTKSETVRNSLFSWFT